MDLKSFYENYGSHIGINDEQYKNLGVLQNETEILKSVDILVQLGMLSDEKTSNERKSNNHWSFKPLL